jgi:hypothetical protein
MLRILTTSIIVLAFAVAAQAAPLTYTVSYTGTIDSSGTIQIPKYTGTESLVKVTLEMTATATAGSVTYTSTDAEAQDVTLAIGADLTATGPTGGVNPNIFVLNVIPATTASYTIAPYGSQTLFGGTDTDTDSADATDPPTDLSFFVASLGDTDFDVDVVSNVYWGAFADGTGTADGTAGAVTSFVTVTYEIPEPATMSLLAIGGIAALVRRRKS